MAWTAAKTWGINDELDETTLNTYVRDNQNHLKDRLDNNEVYALDEGADYTTTSASFVDIDATALGVTITTNGGDVEVLWTGSVGLSNSNTTISFEIDVDGSPFFGDSGMWIHRQNTAGYIIGVTLHAVITGLTAGSHTIKLQWAVSAGTGTLYANNVHGQFSVMEK